VVIISIGLFIQIEPIRNKSDIRSEISYIYLHKKISVFLDVDGPDHGSNHSDPIILNIPRPIGLSIRIRSEISDIQKFRIDHIPIRIRSKKTDIRFEISDFSDQIARMTDQTSLKSVSNTDTYLHSDIY